MKTVTTTTGRVHQSNDKMLTAEQESANWFYILYGDMVIGQLNTKSKNIKLFDRCYHSPEGLINLSTFINEVIIYENI